MRIGVLLLSIPLFVTGCSKALPTLAHYKPVSFWVESLQDSDARVRKKAVQVLSNVGTVDSAVLPALIAAVADRDVFVRREAILALLRMGPAAQEAVPALTQAQRDGDTKVREYAAKALARIQNTN